MSAGIDYGLGETNVDKANGIRYGVISQQEVCQAWAGSSEADYGKPSCPKCGNEALDCKSDIDDETLAELFAESTPDEDGHKPTFEQFKADASRDDLGWETGRGQCGDYACDDCRYLFDGEEAYGEEALGFTLDDGEYQAQAGQDGDIFILKSPYYTRAQFCSPCAPGAAYLMNPCEDGPKAYCFGHDWFDGGKAPYPVYRVDNDELVAE